MADLKTEGGTVVVDTRPGGEASYAPRPTRATLFFRTFLPWQAVRFVAINMKMLRIIARSHRQAEPREHA